MLSEFTGDAMARIIEHPERAVVLRLTRMECADPWPRLGRVSSCIAPRSRTPGPTRPFSPPVRGVRWPTQPDSLGFGRVSIPNVVRPLSPSARSALSGRPGKRRVSGWGRRLEDCVRPGRRPPLPPEATKVYGRPPWSARRSPVTAGPDSPPRQADPGRACTSGICRPRTAPRCRGGRVDGSHPRLTAGSQCGRAPSSCVLSGPGPRGFSAQTHRMSSFRYSSRTERAGGVRFLATQ